MHVHIRKSIEDHANKIPDVCMFSVTVENDEVPVGCGNLELDDAEERDSLNRVRERAISASPLHGSATSGILRSKMTWQKVTSCCGSCQSSVATGSLVSRAVCAGNRGASDAPASCLAVLGFVNYV